MKIVFAYVNLFLGLRNFSSFSIRRPPSPRPLSIRAIATTSSQPVEHGYIYVVMDCGRVCERDHIRRVRRKRRRSSSNSSGGMDRTIAASSSTSSYHHHNSTNSGNITVNHSTSNSNINNNNVNVNVNHHHSGGKKISSLTAASSSSVSDMRTFLRRAKKKFEEKWSRSGTTRSAKTDDFEPVKTVGTGHFGRVVFAQHKPSRKYYALKILEKAKVISSNQLQHVKNEKKILQCVHFPFLVTLKYNFKDNANLYMALDFIPGGEMFSHLQTCRKFSETVARFYSAQVVLSFEYLHHLGIIYRDLKPENLLLDSKGYLKITDFGFAKKIDSRRTWTRCGTTEYLAPEVVLRKGYSYSVDWWTVGILLYEMTNGQPPFRDKNPEDVYTKIIAGKISFPAHMSRTLRNIISELLKIDVTKRLGTKSSGVDEIKRHPFFHNINWMAMLQKKYPAPIVPKINGPIDTSNFQDYEEVPLIHSRSELYGKEFEDF